MLTGLAEYILTDPVTLIVELGDEVIVSGWVGVTVGFAVGLAVDPDAEGDAVEAFV